MAMMVCVANKMDRETIENVLNSVSSSCREEMEIALTSPSEISSSCKQEIQSALARKSDDSVEFVDTEAKQKAALAKKLGFFEDPKHILGMFILAAVAGAGVWIYYVEVARKNKRGKMPTGLRKSPKKQKPDGGSVFD
jgi:hypothetical protein